MFLIRVYPCPSAVVSSWLLTKRAEPPRSLRFRGACGLELTLQPGLAVDVLEGVQHFELTIGFRLADVDVLREVHVGLRLHRAAGTGEGHAALPGFADLVDVEALRLL